LPVGGAVDDELVAGGGEPVDGGLGQELVVHEGEPFNRGWDMFRRGYPCCCLAFSGLSRVRDL
jgi:hypothetical protein